MMKIIPCMNLTKQSYIKILSRIKVGSSLKLFMSNFMSNDPRFEFEGSSL